MATTATSSPRSLPRDPREESSSPRTIPLRPSSAAPTSSPQGELMDETPQGSQNNDAMDTGGGTPQNGNHITPNGAGLANDGSSQATGAAAAAQQPKVVQTAFIHKLYNMLEDQSIRHLITWSEAGDTFLISPSAEFSKVLATYFKHTNISSFVRQLNMYGFHKVSDVFHTGSSETALWEFKHGNGNFKRGDLAGLKEIKRRASRHALIHRDSFSSAPKTAAVQPAPVTESAPDSLEARLNMFEHSLFEVHNRLAYAEQSLAFMNAKCQILTENLTKSYQANIDLSNMLRSVVPEKEHQIHRDASNMKTDLGRRMDALRNIDMTQQAAANERHPSFSQPSFEPSTPASPRQGASNGRRTHLHSRADNNPTISLNNTSSPRRYGSIGANGPRPPAHLPPPPQRPPQVPSPGLYAPRRHTSADIRSNPGWQAATDNLPVPSNRSSFASGSDSGRIPSSPHRPPPPAPAPDPQLRESLSHYTLGHRPAHQGTGWAAADTAQQHSRPSSPPVGSVAADVGGWNTLGARPTFRDVFNSASGPQTRRSSIAHILNEADVTEREDEEDVAPDEVRKRRRMD